MATKTVTVNIPGRPQPVTVQNVPSNLSEDDFKAQFRKRHPEYFGAPAATAQAAGQGQGAASAAGASPAMDSLKATMPSTAGVIHALGLPANPAEARQMGEQLQNQPLSEKLYQMSPIPAVKAVADMPISMGKEWWRGTKGVFSGDPLAGIHMAASMNPLAAPVVSKMSEQGLGTKEAADTGVAGILPLAAGLKGAGGPELKGASDALTGLKGATARAKAREIIHDGLTRQVMDPAQAQLQDALQKARIPEVTKGHPLADLTNAKTGKEFVDALRKEETAGTLDRSLRDLSQSGGLDPQFRQKWLAESAVPYDFVTSGGGRNFRGVFGSIMARPGWAITGAMLGGAAGKLAGMPFVGRALGASGLARVGETIEGKALARDMLANMPPEKPTGFLGKPAEAGAAAAPVDPAAAADRAARIAKLQEMAAKIEGGAAERRTASSQVAAPQGTVSPKDMASIGRSLGLTAEEAKARAIDAVRQFPNDEKAAVRYMVGGKAQPTAPPKPAPPQAPEPVSGGSTPAPAPPKAAPASPVEPQPRVVDQYGSQRTRSNLAKNQRQMAGAKSAPEESAEIRAAQAEGARSGSTRLNPSTKGFGKAGTQGIEETPQGQEMLRQAAERRAQAAGQNYVVSKGGQVSPQGKEFEPGKTPKGAVHVTVLPNGTFRINAGENLSTLQALSLSKALREAKKK